MLRAYSRKGASESLRSAVDALQVADPAKIASALLNVAALVRKAKHRALPISRALRRRVPEGDWCLVSETIRLVLQRRASREHDASAVLRFLVVERLRPEFVSTWFERGSPRLAWDIWICVKDRVLLGADVEARVPKAKLLSRDGPWVWAKDRPYMHKRDKRFSPTKHRSFL